MCYVLRTIGNVIYRDREEADHDKRFSKLMKDVEKFLLPCNFYIYN